MAIGTAIAAVGGLASAAIGASASKKAAAAQSDAADKAAQVQRDAITQARIDAYPWALTGANALYVLMDELGIPRPKTPILPDLTQGPFGVGGSTTAQPQPAQTLAPQPQNPRNNMMGSGSASEPGNQQPFMGNVQPTTAAPVAGTPSPFKPPDQIPMTAATGFRETPGYQFRVSEGEKGVLNNLAALGMKNSGKALKSLESFRQGLADQTYDNWLNRIAGVAGSGQTQTNTNNSQMLGTASQIGGLMQDAGQARASGYVGAANAWQNGIGGVANALGQWGGGGGGFFGGGTSFPSAAGTFSRGLY